MNRGYAPIKFCSLIYNMVEMFIFVKPIGNMGVGELITIFKLLRPEQQYRIVNELYRHPDRKPKHRRGKVKTAAIDRAILLPELQLALLNHLYI